MPRVTIDVTQRSALAVCADCPGWRELRATRAAALQAAADHLDSRAHRDHQGAHSLRLRVQAIATRRSQET